MSIFITVLLFCGSVSIGNIFYISTCVCCKCIKCPLLICYNISYWLFKIFFFTRGLRIDQYVGHLEMFGMKFKSM